MSKNNTLEALRQSLRHLDEAHAAANDACSAAEVEHGCDEEAEDRIIAAHGYGPELEALEDRRTEALNSRKVVLAIAARIVAERRAVDAAKAHLGHLQGLCGKAAPMSDEGAIIRWARRIC